MKLFSTPLLIVSFFILGGAVFKSTAPTRCSTILPTDSVFVLAGESSRIPFALRQLHRHPTIEMYIIGAGSSEINVPSNVIVEYTSKSTHQNAIAIKKIANENGLNRIVLITTVDHFNRAKYLINQELPDVEIAPCPVSLMGTPVAKRLERWATEYIKYIGTLVGIKDSK